jgi:hypothetical protein
MAAILFVWELGKGYGHLAPYRPLVRALKAAGHRIGYCARDLASGGRLFGGEVELLQSPVAIERVADFLPRPDSYAGILHNVGFDDAQGLAARVEAWVALFGYFDPDLIIFDHSPTALLASRAVRARRIVSGSGFLIPPGETPLPALRYWDPGDPAVIEARETQVLRSINALLDARRLAPLERLADLFAADARFLLGFPELDHYPSRQGGEYLGMFPEPGFGRAPQWGSERRPRLFGYLQPSKQLPQLLVALREHGVNALLHCPGVPEGVARTFASDRIRFEAEAIDVAAAAVQCDLAATNGNLATSTALLLHGKPVLTMPFTIEKLITGRRIEELGAGVVASGGGATRVASRLAQFIAEPRYRRGAETFAARWSRCTLEGQLGRMLEMVGEALDR